MECLVSNYNFLCSHASHSQDLVDITEEHLEICKSDYWYRTIPSEYDRAITLYPIVEVLSCTNLHKIKPIDIEQGWEIANEDTLTYSGTKSRIAYVSKIFTRSRQLISIRDGKLHRTGLYLRSYGELMATGEGRVIFIHGCDS